MALSALWAQACHVFTERLRPGTPEFGFILYQPVGYWLVASFFEILDVYKLPFTEQYKVVRREPGRDNFITKRHVIIRVLMQHLVQIALTLVLFVVDSESCTRCKNDEGFLLRASRFVLGMFVMDTWQYWIHRMMHMSPYLYKHLHSVHHNLKIPYAYGALYNSILEGLLLDTMGGVFTHYVAGLDCETATCLFVFANIKTVVDHCNYRAPVNPLHCIFPNSAAFHDIHHDIRGIKMNFSQPFFTHWDWLLSTFLDPAGMHYSVEELKEQQKAIKRSASPSEKQRQQVETKKER